MEDKCGLYVVKHNVNVERKSKVEYIIIKYNYRVIKEKFYLKNIKIKDELLHRRFLSILCIK